MFQRHVSDLLGYLACNQDALVHYAVRRRRGEPISTTFVESAVNEIVAKRMNKKQQMRCKAVQRCPAGSTESGLQHWRCEVKPLIRNRILESANV